ncbi:MAG: tRNA uridine(34) 5-carboxymethylaminomethyl modification radical SAM/GNAT enzyme Elp3 [Candidatus Portnoybacteria bacterium]|nr:tRNA uridine(34) 5-carboxymethylaminomethyl modification radical SAM/GNAT enzyme Elp3 [Candidatus Portnoybacteria bacterium]
MSIEKYIVKTALKDRKMNKKKLDDIRRQAAFKFKSPIPDNMQLLQSYHRLLGENKIKKNYKLENLLKTRKVRSMSGIVAITLITKPYPCPGNCLYCPDEKDMPKSYLANEPACMRAALTSFDPYLQTKTRIKSLQKTGHHTDKIEIIVLGGCWNAYPKRYQTYFIKRCLDACNEKTSSSLEDAKKMNEGAKNKMVGLTLETRPDLIDKKEIKRLRWLGCTRVELGVQSIYDDVLRKNRRGHGLKEIVKATKLLKDAGLKVTYHIMPNLPGSSFKKDIEMFKALFSDSRFQPDQLKIYPCVVLESSPLYKLWKRGKYTPYDTKKLTDLLVEIKKIIPSYVRIVRVIRDIPSGSIAGGNKVSNLRQVVQRKMRARGENCRCIRCREIKGLIPRDISLSRIDYTASDGKEIFLSFEDKKQDKLLAFLRLRISSSWTLPSLKECGLIREVHTYGSVVPVSQKNKRGRQHKNLGKKLIKKAERLIEEEGYKKVAVISGIGVRGYYRKLGYRLKDEYMIKKLG